MKKLISVFALCALFCCGIFAQSDEYTTLLKKAKDYEEKKNVCFCTWHLLGCDCGRTE